MTTLTELFGNWSGARLGARRFAILWVLLFVLAILGFALAALIIGVTAHELDVHKRAPTIAGIVFMVSAILFFAGMLNITLKRGRDIGVPGFLTAIGFFVTLMMGGVPMLFNIVLALVPEGTFRTGSA